MLLVLILVLLLFGGGGGYYGYNQYGPVGGLMPVLLVLIVIALMWGPRWR